MFCLTVNDAVPRTRYLVCGRTYTIGRNRKATLTPTHTLTTAISPRALPPVSNTIALSEDRCASREHGVFAVERRGADTALVYTDRSHYGSTVDGAAVHGARVTLLTSAEPERTCALVLGKTSLTARVAAARVYLLADDSSRTGAAQRGAAACRVPAFCPPDKTLPKAEFTSAEDAK